MLNETVRNMELIITEMKGQFVGNSENYKALKTLSNSYHTLLKQLLANPDNLKELTNMESLECQKSDLINLKNRLETTSIPALLIISEYTMVNHVTTATTKLIDSIRDMEYLLDRYVYEFHRKKVAVISNYKEQAKSMVANVVEKLGEEIINDKYYLTDSEVNTKSYTITAYKYSDFLKGRRFDEIYVDNDLKDIKEIESLVKNKNNIYYFGSK